MDRHGVRPDPEAVEAVLTWKASRTDTQLLSFLGFANYYREFIKGYADKVYPMQKLMRNKGKKFEWNDEAQVAFENIKRELCEARVLGMPRKKGMYVLDKDASVVAISGMLHQQQEWNGRTVLRPIAYGSKVLSDTEMKYGAPKAEMFAVVTFVEKYRAYLGSAPFKLRVDNRALSWLKTYSMDQSYIGRWIVSREFTCRESSRDKDPIQGGPGPLGSVAALKPDPAGTLSHEHKQPLITGQNGAGHTSSDADAGWIVRKRSDQR